MIKGKVISVSYSAQKGPKNPEKEISLDSRGVIGDVHAGTKRPVSIIDISHVDRFRKITEARETSFGEFAENITTEGLKDFDFQLLDKLKIGDVLLEVIQMGKPFHDQFRELGNYVMPRVGVFCRVLKNGKIQPGDEIEVFPKEYRAMVITLSDRASRGEYEDKSGPTIYGMLEKYLQKMHVRYRIEQKLIADDDTELKNLLDKAKQENFDFIITTGGTGIGPRDITVETVQDMLDKEIPGIMEMIRMKYGQEKPNALLSRGVAGVMGTSLVYTLPGSMKAVKEYMTEISKTLQHLVYMLHGIDAH